MIEHTVFSVTQLNTYVKSILEGDIFLRNVFVVGEISNFTNHYRTGHFYMTLKDESSCIKAVMFKSANQRLRFLPENGMGVIVRGRVSLYDRDGQYQLYIEDMQPDGIGALNLAFEQLKNKLASEGLFNECHKKKIPVRCRRIGVVTSATGAVIQDIKNVVSRRYPLAEIVLVPVEVQGVNAAPQIAEAIDYLNCRNDVDVMIVGRGGGSIEDLWAFNEEIVARAVFRSEIPVISAVGHETDFTICDFVADLRAPTPSAAAELAVPDIRDDITFIFGAIASAKNVLDKRIDNELSRLVLLQDKLDLLNPTNVIGEKMNTVSLLYNDALNNIAKKLTFEGNRFSVACAKLDSLSPIKVLGRGYSIAMKNGVIINSVKAVKSGDRISVKFSDGEKDCEVL